jgi:uncharacterized membrane protein (DUF2068 family)
MPSPTENTARAGMTPRPRGPLGFRIIGILKLLSGSLLFVAWLGMFRLFKSDLGAQVDWLVRHLRLDPDNRVFHLAIDWITALDRKHLRAIEAGTFFYAALHIVEGTGLILQRYWAGFLTVIATSALVPFEIYEIVARPNPLKVLVLVVNLGFVVYVIVKLRQELRDRALRRGAEPS